MEEQNKLDSLSYRQQQISSNISKKEKWALGPPELLSLKKPKAGEAQNQKFSYSEIERKYAILLKQMNQELESRYSAQVKGVNSVSRP